jgi:Tfp pilus assembly PilM family ATPase
MDTGSEATNLLFSFPDFLWFRATMLGGDDLVTALARRFKVTHDVAERVKLEPHRVKRLGELYEESSLVYRKLTSQFESAMSELRRAAPRKNPRQLVISGGAALSFGLLRYLRYGP